MLKMEEKNEKYDSGDVKEVRKESGIMTGLISDLVEGRKIENLENETESDDKVMISEPGNGGIISNIISKLVSPNQEAEENEKSGVQSDEKKESGEHKSGGIITDMISKLVSPNHEGEENEKSGDLSDEKEENGEKIEEHKSGGGNIIDNIVSHLPSSLKDDLDPPTDEASILIHSIIHD